MVKLEDALAKIGAMEGATWMKLQGQVTVDDLFTLPWAAYRVKERQKHLQQDEPDPRERERLLNLTFGAIIYGVGGWRRYSVKANGEVVYLAQKGSEQDAEKARSLGFEVYD